MAQKIQGLAVPVGTQHYSGSWLILSVILAFNLYVERIS
jgi:hypothetical protein